MNQDQKEYLINLLNQKLLGLFQLQYGIIMVIDMKEKMKIILINVLKMIFKDVNLKKILKKKQII